MIKIIIPEPIPSLNKGELAILEGIREALSYLGKEYVLTVYSPPSWAEIDKKNANNQYDIVTGTDLFDLENSFSEKPLNRGKLNLLRTWGKLFFFAITFRLSRKLSNILFRDSFFNAIADSDLVIAGHDGMLCSDHFYMAIALKIMKKPFAFYGGSNDLKGNASCRIRKYYRFMIDNAILCTVRDPAIKEYFVKNTVSPDKIHVYPDPAVLLKPCDEKRINSILIKEHIPISQKVPLYGLIPVAGGIVYNKSFSSETEIDRKHLLRVYLWKEIIKHLLISTKAHLVFIPHCIGPVSHNDDRKIYRDIYESLIEIGGDSNRITLIDTEYSAAELKALMRKCDFVLGERAHALIGSISVGTPCMALTVAEDLRMHYLMEDVFNRPTYNLNSPDIEDLKELITKEWLCREQTVISMQVKMEEIRVAAIKAAELLKNRVAATIRLQD